MDNFTLDGFCGSEFWNSNLTWYTEDPDLTICFEKTVLVWIPCIFLWMFSSIEVYYILSSKRADIPWTVLNISKLLVTEILIILTITDLVTTLRSYDLQGELFDVDIYTPIIKIFTFVLSAVLLVYNCRCGLQTSGLQFLFWLLCVICGLPQLRTEIRNANSDKPDPYYYYISYIIYYVGVLVMLLLNCFADSAPRRTKYPLSEKPCPLPGSSFLSRMFYTWFDKLAWTGFKKPLEATDIWDMNPEDYSRELVPVYDKHWENEVEKCRSATGPRASFKANSGRVDFGNTPKIAKEASILTPLWKTFGGTFAFGAFLKLIQDVLMFVSPKILDLIISYVQNKDSLWKGFLYAIILFVTTMIQTLVLSDYFNRMFLVGMRIRTVLISSIYRKALRMSNTARKDITIGEIVNLVAVDAQRFIDLTPYLNMIWSAPLQIIIALYYLWIILGPSVLAGLAVMIILIPINGYVAKKVTALQISQMQNKDERIKLMNEILGGIKVLKLYAWEPSFEEQVLKYRGKEIKVLKKAAYLHAIIAFMGSCAPILVALVTFWIYVCLDNVLTPQIVFVSLTLFAIIRLPMSLLPLLIVYMVETYVSVKRINKFMNSDELVPDSVTHEADDAPLTMENATFTWGEDPILKNINLRFERGGLTAVVGTVGCGKSSLLSGFLGEMNKTNGRVNTVGSIALVPQQAWIQNATIRDNIVFGGKLDKERYDKIVVACALKPDFDMLPGGDQTEIGEKGINVSGGQKQRISLARAVYNDSDIYFLDDPLSAVDSHVGKHIFDNVLGPNGILKSKTRVLVTHAVTFLPEVDNIVVLQDGQVTENGTYEELLAKKGCFADFLIQHIAEFAKDEDSDKLKELTTQLQTSGVAEDIVRKLTRQLSQTSDVEVKTTEDNGVVQQQKSPEAETTTSGKDEPASGEKLIEEEKAETGSVKLAVYKHYMLSIGIALSVTTIVFKVIFQVFNVGSNLWLSIWSDDAEVVVNGTIDTGKRDMYLGVYAALGLGQAITVFISSMALYIGALSGAHLLHNYLLTNILRAPNTEFFDVTPIGRILNRFSKDIDTMDNILPFTMHGWLTCFFGMVATLVVISFTTPVFVSVILPIGVLYFFIQRFYVATSRQLKRLESVSRSPIYSHISESVSGSQTIRAYGVQERFIGESEDKVDFNQASYYPSIIANRWLAVRLETIGNVIIFFAALFAVLGKDQNAGMVGLSVAYALQITQSLNWLVRATSDVETNIVAVERIKEYGETPQEAPWEISSTAPDSSWPHTGAVEFKQYAVRYRTGLDLVLKGISFSINGGEKVGIVGRTGAGKSSLTLALFRIIEASEGEIIIDGINIAKLGLHALRSRLTIIPQDAVLFSGNLRLNLDPYNCYSDDELWTALEHAHLKTFIKGTTGGLNHEVTEGGENFSVGQRQLICLSRALLRKSKVLILDEATAAVDLDTDDLIQKTIRTEFNECTILTIAHRLNTIMDSNRVIVLDKGLVVEFDTPAALLQNKKSIFFGMAKEAGLAE